MSYLVPFVCNTILRRANDPENKTLFLPKVLAQADGSNSKKKLLPIEVDEWKIGTIGEQGGKLATDAFINNWADYLEKKRKMDLSNQYPVAALSTPYPFLTLGGKSKVTVSGLENIFVRSDPMFAVVPSGYRVKATLEIGHWNGLGGRVKYPLLSIDGPYLIAQKLVLADKRTGQPTGHDELDINDGGTVKVEVPSVLMETELTISIKVSESGTRELEVTVHKLALAPLESGSMIEFKIVDLTVNVSVSEFLLSIWKRAATDVFQSKDGQAGLLKMINTALQKPENLEPLSQHLSEKLATVIKGILGTMEGTSNSTQQDPTINPVDRYMFDRVRFALDDSSSSLFLPQLLCQNQGPSLNPLHIDSFDLPLTDDLKKSFEKVRVEAFDFFGLTNVKTPSESSELSNDDVLKFTGVLGAWDPPPPVSCKGGIPVPPAHGAAPFSVTLKRHAGKNARPPHTGTLKIMVKDMQVKGAAKASGDDDSSLTIEVTQLELAALHLESALMLEVVIESMFKDTINDVINTTDIKNKILYTLNGELSKHLQQISAQVTTYARTAVADRLK